MSKDFHILITARAREGTYQVRLYSVPIALPMMMADANSNNTHWGYLAKTPPVTLDGRLLQSVAPFQIDAESEFEQGVPRYASEEIVLLADPALQIVVENMRDVTKNIWCEISLIQNVLDAPVDVRGESLIWPVKEKLCFWGPIDRKSCKGKINNQKMQGPDKMLRAMVVHDGTLSLVFNHWITTTNFQNVKALLDLSNTAFDYIDGGGSKYLSAQRILIALMASLCPTPYFLVGDSLLLQATGYTRQNWNATPVTNIPKWGKMPITIKPPDGTSTTMLSKVYVKNVLSGVGVPALFFYDPTVQVHTLTSDQGSSTLYHWNDLGQALTEWCREFFLTWQVELPTLGQASAPQPDVKTSTRFLLLGIDDTPYTIALDPFVETIEYDPCGAWTTTYTISEPSSDGLVNDIFGSTGPRVADSPLLGGQDESYTTLLRFCGFSSQGGTILPDARGWEIYVPDASNTLTLATIGEDNATGTGYGDWAALHAWKKIYRWGWPHAIVTLTSKGVGLEPWGQSAGVYNGSKLVPITPPKLTFDFHDYSDFPLSRGALILPGLLTGNDGSVACSVISIKRTPNGDTELKLIEVASGSTGSGGVAPPPATVVVAPPPGGPPPPPTLGGPPDTGPITITGL